MTQNSFDSVSFSSAASDGQRALYGPEVSETRKRIEAVSSDHNEAAHASIATNEVSS